MPIDNTFIAVLTASGVSALVTCAGIYVIVKFAIWGQRNAAYFMGFAAGILMTTSLMHLLPEAYEMSPQAPIWVLVGFMTLYISNRILHIYGIHDHHGTDLTLGVIPMIGIGIHSLLDGFIHTVTFNVSVFTGVLASIGMVLHEFPEGIVTFLLLARGGFSLKNAILWAVLAAGLTTPLGTLIAYPFVHQIEESILGVLLAFSAGALVYVGATHLIPAMEKEERPNTLWAMFGGIAIALVIVFTSAH
ncbi:MAG: ZIP family metal transporter [Brevefilum sp.]